MSYEKAHTWAKSVLNETEVHCERTFSLMEGILSESMYPAASWDDYCECAMHLNRAIQSLIELKVVLTTIRAIDGVDLGDLLFSCINEELDRGNVDGEGELGEELNDRHIEKLLFAVKGE